jgi:hypothetical protein
MKRLIRRLVFKFQYVYFLDISAKIRGSLRLYKFRKCFKKLGIKIRNKDGSYISCGDALDQLSHVWYDHLKD